MYNSGKGIRNTPYHTYTNFSEPNKKGKGLFLKKTWT